MQLSGFGYQRYHFSGEPDALAPLVQSDLVDYQPKERCKRVGFEADSRAGKLRNGMVLAS